MNIEQYMKSDTKTLILSRGHVQQIVQHYGPHAIMDHLIGRLTKAIKNFDPQNTDIPIRSGFHYNAPRAGLVEMMPLHKRGDRIVIKVVGYHPANPKVFNLPTILSTVSAYSTSTGHLMGIMDGVLLTALRTGAASAVASQHLAHPGSTTLGLIGCGAQAVTQLHALSRVFDLRQVLIYDIDPQAIKSFAQRCEMLEINASVFPASMEKVVETADILCTATSIKVGTGPLFPLLPTRPHLHINAIGSDFPGKTELPLQLLRQSFVCPDFTAQALLEGECQQLKKEEIGPDCTEVVQHAGKYIPIKYQRSVFDSTGWALQDQVAMEMFLEYAEALGIGSRVAIEDISKDAKNPYQFLYDKILAPNH